MLFAERARQVATSGTSSIKLRSKDKKYARTWCAQMAAAVTASAEDEKASFWVEKTHLDLGTVVAGETANATFVFHNDGADDVHIIRATPS